MAKKKKSAGQDSPAQISEALINIGEAQNYHITSGAIKDDYCNYSYVVIKGIGAGFNHKTVEGDGFIIHPDLSKAFEAFKVHFACADDIFRHANIEVDNIDNFHDHPLTDLYTVTGFKIKGSDDNESVTLTGNKYLFSTGERISFPGPKLALDDKSPYPWYNELKAAVEIAKREVALYGEGKYTREHPDEKEKKDPAQISLLDQEGVTAEDNEFEGARVD